MSTRTSAASKRRASADEDRRFLLVACAVALAIALTYVFAVKAGAPADEPSHLTTLRFYVDHLRMPVLGQPGVVHEGQQGPLFYVLAGPVYKIGSLISDRLAFYLVRPAGALLVIPEVLLVHRLSLALAPGNQALARLTTLFVGLNPSFLAELASLQNEMLSVVISLLAILVTLRMLEQDRLTLRSGAVLGGLVGVAILAKAIAIFLVISIPIAALLWRRRRSVRFILSFAAAAAAVSGWWFARNYILYGDLTAQAGLARAHYGNNAPPIALWQPAHMGRFLYGFAAYYSFPTEFYRSLFHVPLLFRLAAIAFPLLGLAGLLIWWRRRPLVTRVTRLRVIFGVVQVGVCVAFYAYASARVTFFAPRSTFPIFPLYAAFVCWGVLVMAGRWQRTGRLAATGLVVATLLIFNVYVLQQSIILRPGPWALFSG